MKACFYRDILLNVQLFAFYRKFCYCEILNNWGLEKLQSTYEIRATYDQRKLCGLFWTFYGLRNLHNAVSRVHSATAY